MLRRRRLLAFAGGHANVPLAEVRRAVAGLLQYLRDRDFALEQMRVVQVVLQHAVNARSQVLPSGHQGCSRRRTDCRTGMKVGEPHTVGGQTIEGRRLHRPAVTADVLPAQVIGQQHDDVWAIRGRGGGRWPSHRLWCGGWPDGDFRCCLFAPA